MKKRRLLFVGLVMLIISCSKDAAVLVPLNPDIATLISPINNETCLDGISLNDTQSNVDFSWSSVANSVSYEVVVTNLLTQSSQTFTAPSNQTTIALTKAEPYAWHVLSIGEVGTISSQSEQWKFYLAGDAQVNYAPFPSELISPRSGANITPNLDDLINLNWTTTDVDGDLSQFEVYLDQTDATTLVETLDYQSEETAIEIEVEANVTYYWKIIAIDANGSTSSSGVYAFRTN